MTEVDNVISRLANGVPIESVNGSRRDHVNGSVNGLANRRRHDFRARVAELRAVKDEAVREPGRTSCTAARLAGWPGGRSRPFSDHKF